jgi:N6-adenosine-specific RNA methylase IME4
MRKYDIIYADPPWKQIKGGIRKCRPHQGRELDYNTLELADIKNIILNVPTEENHVLFLWTIDKFLHEAEVLFSSYKLHARLIWDKTNGVAPAFTVRFSHEYLLWFYAGTFQKVAEAHRGKYTTVLREKATRHSRKPDIVRKMIEDFYPSAKRIELFAREKFTGWDAFGNEVDSDLLI